MRKLGTLFLAMLTAACVGVAPAHADFGVEAFDGSVSANPAGDPYTQAGGHPYDATTTLQLNHKVDALGNNVPDGGAAKDVEVTLPPGFVGDPTAAPTCPADLFLEVGSVSTCPAVSQVGLASARVGFGPFTLPIPTPSGPVYNLDPSPGAVALFGFHVSEVPIFLEARLTSDGTNRVQVVSRNTSQTLSLLGASVSLWGIPADPSHDPDRRCQGVSSSFPGCSTEADLKPFLTNPTACTPPGHGLLTELRVNSWAHPDTFAHASFESHDPPGFSLADPLATPLPHDQWGPPKGPTGCEKVPFDPKILVEPTSHAPDSPTGLDVSLSFPTDGLENPTGISQSHLKKAVVTLPEGMTISPSAADGLEACSDQEVALASTAPARCPVASKVGSATVVTPLLKEALRGSIYVGGQQSDDPESGRMFRIFMVLESKERGITIKLPGLVRANSQTGRLETTFDNNPQLPFSNFSLHFDGGPRAPLATPPTCGTKVVAASLTPWSGNPAAELHSSFTIDCPDVSGFSPSLIAGTTNATGGAFSPFVAQIHRRDREQYLAGVTLQVPGGLVAKLRGVPLCGEIQAAAGTCPVDTRVGTAVVGAGPGSNPFFLRGSVSLTGPYKGAPYGLSVAIRALAGPFDLGVVVVRQAIFVDPVDAHLTVVSDPLPVIVKGVPVRLRSVNVDIDRPGFTINPTNCAEKQIKATFASALGAIASQAVQFEASGCRLLSFAPKLALRLTGKGQTTDGRHPGLRAVLTHHARQANLRKVVVKLPTSLALDPGNAQVLCEFEQGQKPEPSCPKGSIVGHARATTPLLNRPLVGPVYFVKNIRIDPKTGRRIRTLPTLLIALRGEVALNVRQTTAVAGGRLVATTASPDAQVSSFELTLNGGRHGILVVSSANLCHKTQTAGQRIDAQNGARVAGTIKMKTPCKRAARNATRANR